MDAPDVDLAISITKHLPNLLDLPLISTLTKLGIKTGAHSVVAPRSMTIDLKSMLNPCTFFLVLVGFLLNGIVVDFPVIFFICEWGVLAAIGDSKTLGVLVITIHYGEGLSAQDRNGWFFSCS